MFYLVIVEHDEFSDSAARQHFGGDRSDAADADDSDGAGANLLVVVHDPHPLQGHQTGVRVRVHHLERRGFRTFKNIFRLGLLILYNHISD